MDSSNESETKCSRLTGPGRAAIAVVGVWGRHASQSLEGRFIASSNRPLDVRQVRYGVWQNGVDAVSESVVVVPVGPDRLEIHCHGGAAAVNRIIKDLSDGGVRPAEPVPGDWLAGDPDATLARDAMGVLMQCVTEKTAAIALVQVRGALRRWAISSLARISSNGGCLSDIRSEAADIANRWRIGKRLTDPAHVVIAGPPNVGKSTLINALVGFERAITMDLPGTTRDVLGTDTVLDGWPIRLSDTAGVRESESVVETEGIARARSAIDDADLVIWVIDRVENLSLMPSDQTRCLRVFNKADLAKQAIPEGFLPTVAIKGSGVDELVERILERLVGDIPANAPIPVTEHQRDWLKSVAEATTPDQMIDRLQIYQS